jgi:hypothetical protein
MPITSASVLSAGLLVVQGGELWELDLEGRSEKLLPPRRMKMLCKGHAKPVKLRLWFVPQTGYC